MPLYASGNQHVQPNAVSRCLSFVKVVRHFVPGVNSSSALCHKYSTGKEAISHVTGNCTSNKLILLTCNKQIPASKGFDFFDEVYGTD